jgi:hypothetical protein
VAGKQKNPQLIPFFPYDASDREKQLDFIKRKYKEREISHKARFATIWKTNAQSQRDLMARSKASIQRSIDLTRMRTKQFVNLTKIDQSIIRERTREYLQSSKRRIKNEMDMAQQMVRSKVEHTSPGNLSLKDQMNRARNYTTERVLEINRDISHSAGEILRSKELMRRRYIQIHDEGESEFLAEKETARIAENVLNSKDYNSQTRDKTRIAQDERKVSNSKVKTQLDLTRKNVQSATADFVDNAKRTRFETGKVNQNAIVARESDLHEMQKHILDSKELFKVDVRFAQAKVREASKKSEVIGIQMTVALAERRKTAIARAKARRKAQTIRNALALIRTIG